MSCLFVERGGGEGRRNRTLMSESFERMNRELIAEMNEVAGI